MELIDKIRKYESMHIVFWLTKDTCWMLELRTLGAIMIAPTLFLAVYLVVKTRQTKDVFINTAIFFWILANSFWMLMEFFNHNHYKNFAAIPFGIGFLFVGIFYLNNYKSNKATASQ